MVTLKNRELRDFFGNPFSILCLSLVVSALMLYVSHEKFSDISIWQKIIDTAATAVITSGTFGVLFEFYGKRRLVFDAVRDAVGQSNMLQNGVSRFLLKVNAIDYDDIIENSNTLVVGFRQSASFIHNNKEKIIKRLSQKGRGIILIRMSDASIFPANRTYSDTPEEYLGKLEKISPIIKGSAEVFLTDEKLSYNFVRSDGGIWVKLYFNSEHPEMPPAFFVSKDSDLYKNYANDIDLLLKKSKKVM